jgi:Response regulator containing CheY-like receiver, AAA-type ATPase, and DNA-binding domains
MLIILISGKVERKTFMGKNRILIVDDSSFSIAVIRGILEEKGFEVVGEAGTLEEVKEAVKEKKPTLVTMDMTLPGTDGLECTRAIHEIDESIKVIVISSMMDEEIVKEAKNNNVCAYIQKPVDGDELITVINRVTAADELYQFLENEYFAVFKEALMDGINRMTKTLLSYKMDYDTQEEFESKGITILIGIIGKFSGRMFIDLSKETAENLSLAILKRTPKSMDEIVAMLAEFTNIVSGNACSILNRKNNAMGLRVAPPTILRGDKMLITAPDFNTKTAIADTNYGEIMLNIGFKRGDDKWM